MVNTAMSLGIINRRGAYYSFAEQQWQGKDATYQAFREDLDIQNALKEAVIGAVLK
jgi:hypothetical protein